MCISKPQRKSSVSCIARLLVTYVALTAAFHLAGSRHGALWSEPILRVAQAFAGSIEARDVDAISVGGDAVFRLTAVTRSSISVGRDIVPAGTEVTATTLQAYGYSHFILVLTILAAWPAAFRRRMMLLGAGMISASIAVLLDVPLVLVGVAQNSIEALAVMPESSVTFYYRFLDGGGRVMLSLCAAGLIIALFSPHGIGCQGRDASASVHGPRPVRIGALTTGRVLVSDTKGRKPSRE